VLLFCDTSALIKLLIDEPESAQIHQVTEGAALIAACRITWAEAMAAMARRQRDDPTSAEEIESARQRLSMLWSSFTIVEVSQKLVEAAGRFADGFALRGFDRVQLATAHELQDVFAMGAVPRPHD